MTFTIFMLFSYKAAAHCQRVSINLKLTPKLVAETG
jgi:hypothetical protein